MVHRILGGSIAAMALVAGSSLFVSAPAHAAADCTVGPLTTTCVFPFTGSSDSWTVPVGVVEATVDLYGAQGGSIGTSFTVGGFGGRATAVLDTVPGSQLVVTVGGAGSSLSSCGATEPASGGYNGGGDGGGSGPACRGAGGGGATDIRASGGSLVDRLLIAGGGGGSANGVDGIGPFFGGAGGGLVGGTGGSGTQGGVGGDQSGGGSGLLGQGGAGTPLGGIAGGAGGGGGGYYGGAGGRDNGSGVTSHGGGGGSGFGPAGTVFETGVRAGNGEARITYPTVALSNPSASTITGSSVQLAVTVNPRGRADLPVQIRYGTDASSLTSIVTLDPVSGTQPVTRAVTVTGLTAGTTYVFEAIVPGDSTTAAVSGTFTTTASVTPASTSPAELPATGSSGLTPWALVGVLGIVAGGLIVARTRTSGRSTP